VALDNFWNIFTFTVTLYRNPLVSRSIDHPRIALLRVADHARSYTPGRRGASMNPRIALFRVANHALRLFHQLSPLVGLIEEEDTAPLRNLLDNGEDRKAQAGRAAIPRALTLEQKHLYSSS
jgi:hypothetical protein